MQNTYIAIMAGGIGSRFWPASRTSRPKQFLDILGVGKSLLRMTFDRFRKLVPAEQIYIVTNKQYFDLVKEHLPELTNNQILCEPSRNNTAPCVAYTAFKLYDLDPEAKLVVAPSDHIILDEGAFIATLKRALAFARQNNALLTLGIQPTRPDTGYGYINYEKTPIAGDVHKVKRFTEKPPPDMAREFLASGDYLWNAGIFVWKVEYLLQAFQQHAADIHQILSDAAGAYNTDQEQAFIDKAYPTTPKISIDYAILEKAGNVYTIPSQFGWSDLGTWASLHAESGKDATANVVQADKAMLYNVHNSLIRVPGGKLVVVKDLDNYIIVDEGDVLLIHPKGKEQEIKHITGECEDNYK